jgi:hypothetical protein
LAYAKSAFKDIAATRPDLIDKFDQSGLGSDPSVLEFLAQHGRLQAGMMGDSTVSQRYSSPSAVPQRPLPRGQSAAQTELNEIYKKNPPGTEGYKAKAVQARVQQLQESIHGTGNIIGQGGRTA